MSKTKDQFPICNDSRGWCMGKRDGRCFILTSTYEKDGACPFYKKMEIEGQKIKSKPKK